MIRVAQVEDIAVLTDIAFAAKRHWNYPEEYIQKWKNELTITEIYVTNNIVRCKEIDNRIVGFYSIFTLKEEIKLPTIYLEAGAWLDHMFIIPEYHNRRIGTDFFIDINETLLKEKQTKMKIFVDPNATVFYEKMGAKFCRLSASSIPDRQIPVYEYCL